MTTDECYNYLAEYYNEQVATDLCNCFDSTHLTKLVEYLKEGNGV